MKNKLKVKSKKAKGNKKSFMGLFCTFNFLLLTFNLLLTGCHHHKHYVFLDQEPVQTLNDRQTSQIPEKSRPFNFVEYSVSSSARYPVVEAMDIRRIPWSMDVNSADQVPSSAWFTPRLGSQNISSEELLKGPAKIGPPQPPLSVTKAKTSGNSPGFIVRDSRGHQYLIKFDVSDYPYLESTVNLVTNRLFWGFGYHVPEDYLFSLDPETLTIHPDSKVTQDEIDQVLVFSFIDDDGFYRSTASLMLEGFVLGPTAQRNTRNKDSNDLIPHQHRRSLRGLRMFSAWTGQSGLRSDNSIDVYEGAEGQGHTVHYLIDFGEAMGVHGVQKNRAWDGYEHFFSYYDSFKKYIYFGFPVRAWENLKLDPSDAKGYFEAEIFKPEEWRETTQFLPIRYSKPDDDYWAAKILAGVTREHLETLFKAAKNPDQDYVDYLIKTLLIRQQKVLNYALERVSPIEAKGYENGNLVLEDRGSIIQKQTGGNAYEVKIYNKNHKKISKTFSIQTSEPEFTVQITPEMLQRAGGYLRVEVFKIKNGRKAPRAAEFHVRSRQDSAAKLAGVVH